MKLTLTITFLLWGWNLFSQSLVGKLYEIEVQAELYIIEESQYVNFSFDPNSFNVTIDFRKEIIDDQFVFKVVSEFTENNVEYAVLKFLKFIDKDLDNDLNGYSTDKKKHYIIKKSSLSDKTLFEEIPSRWDIGTVTIPFKLRVNPGAIVLDPNISGVAQFRIGKINPFWRRITILGGFGLGSVSVNSSNTEGEPASSQGVLTFLTGASLRLGGSIDFLLTTGIDKQLNPPARGWRYENDPWIGIGLGFDLLKKPAASADTQSKK